MRTMVDPKLLLPALQQARSIIRPHSALPELETLWLDAGPGQFTIRSHNLEQEMRVVVQAATDEIGTLCVPSRYMLAVVQSMADGDSISLVKHGELLNVQGSSSVAEVPWMDAARFPAQLTGSMGGELIFEIEEEELAGALRWLSGMTNDKDFRPMCHGIHLIGGHGAIATDGKMAGMANCLSALPDSECLVLPPGALNAVIGMVSGKFRLSLFRNQDGEITVATFENESALLTTRLLSVGGAAVSRNLLDFVQRNKQSMDGAAEWQVDRDAMLGAIDAVASIGNAERMMLRANGSNIELSAQAGGGRFSTSIPAACPDNEERYISPRVLRLGIEAATDDNLTILQQDDKWLVQSAIRSACMMGQAKHST